MSLRKKILLNECDDLVLYDLLALLCGDLNYSDTITLAVSAGGDTDCNGGTAGSICGAAVGRKGIEDRWIDPLNDTLKTCVADVGQISIQSLIERIATIRRKSIE